MAIISFLFLSFIFSANNVSAADGAKIFKQNCAVCHSLGTNKLTGPGLAGIASRAPGDEWLKKWIKNSDALRKSGDAYAIKVYNDNNQVPMSAFEFLSDEELTALVEYIKAPPAPEEKKKDAAPVADGAPAPAEEGINPLALLIGIIAFLVIIIAVLRGVRFSLKNLQNERDGLPLEEQVGPWTELKNWMSANKTKTGIVILFIVGGLASSGWYALKGIGVYEGYHPVQPIAYSHKIHAGDNAIDCQYCHSGVEKSKTAGIPTVNVCMNCHKGISEGPITGKTEIAKIYEAAGWDPDKGAYTKPEKPIKWVKVHNLPDFVF
ncbi:MAG: c-type cytochrome, partial [Bacteroidia bacterium]|nr:c-type cytochrome [Bacteroidia bacterium]